MGGPALPVAPDPLKNLFGTLALKRIPSWLAGLSGWRRFGVATLLGALAALALPPYSLLPVLLIAFPGLLWLLDGCARARQALITGWAFGFGHFLIGFYWIGGAFLVDAERFAWLLPIAVSLLPAGLAAFLSVAAWLAWRGAPSGWRRLLLFAAAWVAMEWLRAHLLTGFPWNLIGYVWTASDPVMQSMAWFGVYGLGFATIVVAGAPALFAQGRRPGVTACLLAACTLGAVWAAGVLRLGNAQVQAVPGITLRLVQPNIAQRDKWRREQRAAHFERYLSLSARSAGRTEGNLVRHVIWPETATPFLLADDKTALRRAGAVLAGSGLLLTGAPRGQSNSVTGFRAWNGFLVIATTGDVVASYDKHHLVPFGEFLPLRSILAKIGLDKLAPGRIDYTPGAGPRVLRLPGLPAFQPLVCYEVIFPHEVAPEERPDWLLNVTNDAWFGDSAGPYQHFAMARSRAVEQGLPLVRVANTGISGLVDPYGRVLSRLPLNTEGILDVSLPRPIEETVYGRFGDVIPLLIVLVGVALSWRRAPWSREKR